MFVSKWNKFEPNVGKVMVEALLASKALRPVTSGAVTRIQRRAQLNQLGVTSVWSAFRG